MKTQSFHCMMLLLLATVIQARIADQAFQQSSEKFTPRDSNPEPNSVVTASTSGPVIAPTGRPNEESTDAPICPACAVPSSPTTEQPSGSSPPPKSRPSSPKPKSRPASPIPKSRPASPIPKSRPASPIPKSRPASPIPSPRTDAPTGCPIANSSPTGRPTESPVSTEAPTCSSDQESLLPTGAPFCPVCPAARNPSTPNPKSRPSSPGPKSKPGPGRRSLKAKYHAEGTKYPWKGSRKL